MPDTKRGRESQARTADDRQRERDVREERERGDEPEPPDGTVDADDKETGRTCRRRDCEARATFRVVERYQEETGVGAVTAEAYLCRDHTAEEGPANLDGAYDGYLFRIEPLAGAEFDDGTGADPGADAGSGT